MLWHPATSTRRVYIPKTQADNSLIGHETAFL